MAVLYSNNASSALSASITSSATSFSVTAGHGAKFPAITNSDYFYATLVSTGGAIEIVKVTARSTDTFTVVRGQDGTTGTAFTAGDKVELRVTKAMLDDYKVDTRAGTLTGAIETTNARIKFKAADADGGTYALLGLDWGGTVGTYKNFEVYDYVNSRSMLQLAGDTRNLTVFGSISAAGGTLTGAVTQTNGMTAWSTTTPGTGAGNYHIGVGSSTSNAGGAITFGARDASSGTTAQAGIYINSDGAYGTRMYLATTDSYVTGARNALSISEGGVVNFIRARPTYAGYTILDTGLSSFTTAGNATWGGKIQIGGNGGGSGVANTAVVQATDGNLHMDAGSGKSMYLNYYSNGTIYLNGSSYYISSNGSSYNGTAAASSSVSLGSGSIVNSAWAGGGGYPGYSFSGGNSRFGFSSTGGVLDVYADGNFYATDSSYLVLHTANIGDYATLKTSGGRPGVYKLYRNESDDPYNVQTTWSVDVSGYWSLRGYYNDGYHAPCYVARAGLATTASTTYLTVGSYAWLLYATLTTVPGGSDISGNGLKQCSIRSTSMTGGTLVSGTNVGLSIASNFAGAGTWRYMGNNGNDTAAYAVGLWLRVA